MGDSGCGEGGGLEVGGGQCVRRGRWVGGEIGGDQRVGGEVSGWGSAGG